MDENQKNVSSGKKKAPAKSSRKKYPVKFDKSGFNLMFWVGILTISVGTLLAWASLTAPEGGGSDSASRTTSQRIVSMLPDSLVQWLATIMGFLFIVFGIFCIIKAISLIFVYLSEKKKEQASA